MSSLEQLRSTLDDYLAGGMSYSRATDADLDVAVHCVIAMHVQNTFSDFNQPLLKVAQELSSLEGC